MRLVEEFDNVEEARKFSDFLTLEKIDNRLMPDDEIFEVWVIHEDQLEQAEQVLTRFKENPGSIDHEEVAKKAQKIRRDVKKEAKGGPRYIDARSTVFNKPAYADTALTMLLIIVCVIVAIFSRLGQNTESLKLFFITDFLSEGSTVRWFPGLREVSDGQVWRLVTPIFIHFSPMHLIFNMLWMWELGRMIEDRKGSLFLGIFVVLTAAFSNFIQYKVTSPAFGGMSGVVYALLGYLWMKGKFDPGSNLGLHKYTIIQMIVWFVICFTPLMPNIANGAHTGGLVMGAAWGYLSAKLHSKIL